MKAVHYSVQQLSELGKEQIPEPLVYGSSFIYSSPATLVYNSPGAQGFGVKRAALSVPESIMLLVAPGCCSRNTSAIAEMPAYQDRYFYLMMNETDLVTSRHLKKISTAIREIVDSLETKPKVVMICITCVDALLATDMEAICKKAEEETGVLVRPVYMYALTREGHIPPMVYVRRSIYSMLQKQTRKADAMNILGFFSPLIESCELYTYLQKAGIRMIREISRCINFEQYQEMSQANFNLVLDAQARYAAADLEKRCGIPYIECRRLYQVDKIHSQYQALAGVLGIEIDDSEQMEQTIRTILQFRDAHPDLCFAIGEAMNGDPFELAYALLRYGFKVSEIYSAPNKESYIYIDKISKISPHTQVYSNMEPTMLYYASHQSADVAIGQDACYYQQKAKQIPWNEDIQPFGYVGLQKLFAQLKGVCG